MGDKGAAKLTCELPVTAGGGSFGIYLIDASPTLSAVTIVRGSAGAGGAGGASAPDAPLGERDGNDGPTGTAGTLGTIEIL